MAPNARETRIAHNESRFRDINERLEADLKTLSPDSEDRFQFVCECGLRDCRELAELSIEEYERVRSVPWHFLIRPHHEIDDVEDIVERTERYWVARKREPTHELVEATDPRRD